MQIQTEDILNAIGELETNAILVVDHEGIIRRMNKGVTAVLGYTETDLIGRKVEVILQKKFQKFHEKKVSGLCQTPENGGCRQIKSDWGPADVSQCCDPS
jgi:PAS domain S-box-containing protein